MNHYDHIHTNDGKSYIVDFKTYPTQPWSCFDVRWGEDLQLGGLWRDPMIQLANYDPMSDWTYNAWRRT